MKTQSRKITIHASHLENALSEYLTRYFPVGQIEAIDLSDILEGDSSYDITVYYTNKKEDNVKAITSSYDALPCDVEPSRC